MVLCMVVCDQGVISAAKHQGDASLLVCRLS